MSNEFEDMVESVEEVEKEELKEEKPKTSKTKSTIKAVRVSGIRSGHVMYRAEIDGELYLRLVPVDDWAGDGEQEFEKMKFLGYERPDQAQR